MELIITLSVIVVIYFYRQTQSEIKEVEARIIRRSQYMEEMEREIARKRIKDWYKE